MTTTEAVEILTKNYPDRAFCIYHQYSFGKNHPPEIEFRVYDYTLMRSFSGTTMEAAVLAALPDILSIKGMLAAAEANLREIEALRLRDTRTEAQSAEQEDNDYAKAVQQTI